jgi:hypothetical protein
MLAHRFCSGGDNQLLAKFVGFLFTFCFYLMLTFNIGCGGANGGGAGTAGGATGGTGGTGGGTGGTGAGSVVIQRVEPARVMVGVLQGSATLVGTNFTSSSTVLFDGAAATTFFDNQTLEFELPNSSWSTPHSHTVQVSDPTYGNSNLATYDVYAPQPGPQPFIGQTTQYISEGLIGNGLVPDLNGDGRADLIVSVLDTNSMQYVPEVKYGQADGTFGEAVSLGSFTVQVPPSAILAGDFNGDGYTDLIFLAGSINSQSQYQVLLNDGTGHFSSASVGVLPFNFGTSAPAVAGDFNHDGKLDFAYGGNNSLQTIALFFGNGDGTFSPPKILGAANGIAFTPTAADLNGDGYTDLVYLFTSYNGSNQIRMLLSAPDGSFTDMPVSGLPTPTFGFLIADYNNDHIPDIFAIDQNGEGRAYLGTGNGTFTPTGAPIFAFDGYLVTAPFVTGDFDNDGNMDVATRIALSGPDEVLFLFGDGKGNFTSQSQVSDHSFTLQVGDVNGDGLPDIFSATDPGFGYPSVILGRKDRNFASAKVLIPHTWGLLSAGDVAGNGFNDILVGGDDQGTPATLYRFQGNGTFASVGQPPGYSTVLVDLNGDGLADMVGFRGTDLYIWQGDGSGVFGSPIYQTSPPNGFGQFYFRDMDGDGKMDIVLPGMILYGEGNFQFDPVSMPFYQNFVVGDFDGDGIPDIATGSGILFALGNRAFTGPMGSSPLPESSPPFPTQVAADINGDGKDDLVVGDSGLEIYISAGRQGFYQDQALIVNGYAVTLSSISVADFNGDGLADIAVGMVGGDDLILFTNDGSGKYQVTSYAIGINAVSSIFSDFNHDGKPDLAFRGFLLNFEPPTVTVLLHN